MSWIVGFQPAEAETSEEIEVAVEWTWQAIETVKVNHVGRVLYIKPGDWATPVG